ncbi:hypothetical protein EW145_g6270 [Phellinidium pouzarii]|uniref:Vacuolar calcium ion transporter n=1 Tax=Phellinidium pouzarii TaxID=167371 RepID=A0A4S4KXC5_9AGAM|nr:hypothetical protein EW145_g6270 [Phellinidium pouzarii]
MSGVSSENEPLLPSNGHSPNGHEEHLPFARRVLLTVKAEGEPSWGASLKHILLVSWFNILLVFVPLSFISHYLDWDAALRFGFSFMAIMPLAKASDSTEQLSFTLGQTLSGLLNASFGNAVEIIVGIAALFQDELRIVQTSMLGSILSNLLLVLGCSFLAGAYERDQNTFTVFAAQTSSSLMTLACITLVIPAAYHSSKEAEEDPYFNGKAFFSSPTLSEDSAPHFKEKSEAGLLAISRGTAIMLLIVYIAYLFFQLKTHKHLFVSKPHRQDSVEPREYRPRPANEPEDTQQMSVIAAGTVLLAVTVVTSFCADHLVASIEEVAIRYQIPKAFIGIILIPIVANAAEHVTSVWMAMKNKTELSIGICVGSSIQIAIFVIPLLIIVGWITGHALTLFFADFETIVLFVSVLLVNLLIQDGKSNYMEGLMLVTLYFVIALAFWVT